MRRIRTGENPQISAWKLKSTRVQWTRQLPTSSNGERQVTGTGFARSCERGEIDDSELTPPLPVVHAAR